MLWTEQIVNGGGRGDRQGVEVGRSLLQGSGAGCAPAKGHTTSSPLPAPFPTACPGPTPNTSGVSAWQAGPLAYVQVFLEQNDQDLT